MKTLAIGDSFTYGEELTDRNNAWPSLLAEMTGWSVINMGEPGSGNNRIKREVVENVDDYELFIIAWSHFARMEFCDRRGIYDIWPGMSGSFDLKDLRHRQDLIRYVTRYHNDWYSYREFLINIIAVQEFLKSNNKKFIMINTFVDSNTEKYCYKDKIWKQIDTKNFLGWPNECIQGWTKDTPHGPGKHFLDEGHQLVANKIYEDIRNKCWIS